MSAVSLELFKKHVRADDFDEDDVYLQHLLDVAEEAIVRATERTPAELCDMGGGGYPLALQHAVMTLAAHWYNQRESVSTVQMQQVPDTMDALIKPFCKLTPP